MTPSTRRALVRLAIRAAVSPTPNWSPVSSFDVDAVTDLTTRGLATIERVGLWDGVECLRLTPAAVDSVLDAIGELLKE
jgi:hypothetical protein